MIFIANCFFLLVYLALIVTMYKVRNSLATNRVKNQVMQYDVALQVTDSKFFIEIILSSN